CGVANGRAGSQRVRGSNPLSSTPKLSILTAVFLLFRAVRRLMLLAPSMSSEFAWIFLWSQCDRTLATSVRLRCLTWTFRRQRGRRDRIDGLLGGVGHEVAVGVDGDRQLRMAQGL